MKLFLFCYLLVDEDFASSNGQDIPTEGNKVKKVSVDLGLGKSPETGSEKQDHPPIPFPVPVDLEQEGEIDNFGEAEAEAQHHHYHEVRGEEGTNTDLRRKKLCLTRSCSAPLRVKKPALEDSSGQGILSR